MHRHQFQITQSLCAVLLSALFLLLTAPLSEAAQATPPTPTIPLVGTTAPGPGQTNTELLVWDAVMKELSTTNGQATAEFSFSVTNISDTLVVIDRLMPSCGCTTAKLPSEPWLMAPHSDGKIGVTVNLAGKFGTIYKTVTVASTNAPKTLTLKINIPENPQMARSRNQEMAKADRQAVFRNDCARCHVEPTKAKAGKELYVAACGICHDAEHRADTVPNLHALNHSTDYNYWKVWITTGKAGSMMPAFAMAQGGPLSDEQIASVAKYLSETIPANPQTAQLKLAEPISTK